MSVELRDVIHRYAGSGQGVHGISLAIERGELLAVIGASGCGKSTLLRLVAGLLPLQAGQLLIEGRDVAHTPPWHRSVGMVFQSYALFPHLDVLDNVAYGLRMRGVGRDERRRQAAAMLATVGLSEHAHRRPAQLSGGQQQRVALARALAFKPSVLLLDEPLAALDAHIRGQLCDEIRDVQQRSGAATLFVTHDQQEALMMADRVAVLHQGRLQQLASPRELYERPANLVVARFVGHANLLAGEVVSPGQVRCALGVLQAATGDHATGAAIQILIRPEAVIPDPTADAVNRIEGMAGRVRFMGATCRWDFITRTPTQAPVPASASASASTRQPPAPLLCEGPVVARSAIALVPEALVILADEPTHSPTPVAPGTGALT
jgi:putative spermidine/putrescine transport system ATP-binding protein